MKPPDGEFLGKVRFFVRAFQDKPTAWGGHRSGMGRVRFVPAKEKTVRQEILAGYLQAQKNSGLEHILETPTVVVLRIGVFWRKPKDWWEGKEPTSKPDSSNYLKLFEDALNRHAWTDDSVIVDTACRKMYGDIPGYLGVIWYYSRIPKPKKKVKKARSE